MLTTIIADLWSKAKDRYMESMLKDLFGIKDDKCFLCGRPIGDKDNFHLYLSNPPRVSCDKCNREHDHADYLMGLHEGKVHVPF